MRQPWIALLFVLALPSLLLAEEEKDGAAGVRIEVLEAGEGDPPADGDHVTIDYVLHLPDGTLIGSTIARGRPFELTLEKGRAIEGMLLALKRMKPGSKAKVTIPSALAYGKRGKPSRKAGQPMVIPPDTELVYEITLRKVVRRPPFPTLDAEQAITTSSGLRYWVIDPGSGDPATPEQRVRMAYTLWNQAHAFVFSSLERSHWIDGRADTLTLIPPKRSRRGTISFPKPEPLLREAAALMKPGMRCVFEAPADLTWGNESPDPLIARGSTTWWELHLESVSDIPAFSKPAPDTLETTESGLQYRILREGTGAPVKAGSTVDTHYQGWLEDGKRFDSSLHRGYAQELRVTQVVAGFREGLTKLREGGRAILVIPPALGYGARGSGSAVPPNATILFDVEIVRVR